jgi:hypothetical protein
MWDCALTRRLPLFGFAKVQTAAAHAAAKPLTYHRVKPEASKPIAGG